MAIMFPMVAANAMACVYGIKNLIIPDGHYAMQHQQHAIAASSCSVHHLQANFLFGGNATDLY